MSGAVAGVNKGQTDGGYECLYMGNNNPVYSWFDDASSLPPTAAPEPPKPPVKPKPKPKPKKPDNLDSGAYIHFSP